MRVKIHNFTFCLFITFFAASSLLASEKTSRSKFKSRYLSGFYNVAKKVKAAKLDEDEVCKLFHKGGSFIKEAKKSFTKFNVNSLNKIQEGSLSSVIKEIILKKEEEDQEFWSDGLEIKPLKLNTLAEVVSSHVFNDLASAVDNVYCFPYLGSKFRKNQDRMTVVEALNGVESELLPYIYYDDGFYTKTASVLIVYLIDKRTHEIYSLKGLSK